MTHPQSPQPLLILASSSPRRRELLAERGYTFELFPPSEAAECGLCSGEGPAEFALRMALQKGKDVVERLRANGRHHGMVIACDTVAECQGQVLGKPADEPHARAMLQLLSGREHRVYSGLCVWPLDAAEPSLSVACTVLRMDELGDDAIDDYLATGGWEGKAGAFGYQDQLGWVHIIEGSESNVVGLPMELLEEMLAAY